MDGELIIAHINEQSVNADQILAQTTEDNLHDEVDTGLATGAEEHEEIV